MSRHDLDDPRDPVTFAVRFACGAVLGALVGAGAWVQSFPDASLPTALLIVSGASVGCGLLAAKLGDRFWTDVVRWMS